MSGFGDDLENSRGAGDEPYERRGMKVESSNGEDVWKAVTHEWDDIADCQQERNDAADEGAFERFNTRRDIVRNGSPERSNSSRLEEGEGGLRSGFCGRGGGTRGRGAQFGRRGGGFGCGVDDTLGRNDDDNDGGTQRHFERNVSLRGRGRGLSSMSSTGFDRERGFERHDNNLESIERENFNSDSSGRGGFRRGGYRGSRSGFDESARFAGSAERDDFGSSGFGNTERFGRDYAPRDSGSREFGTFGRGVASGFRRPVPRCCNCGEEGHESHECGNSRNSSGCFDDEPSFRERGRSSNCTRFGDSGGSGDGGPARYTRGGFGRGSLRFSDRGSRDDHGDESLGDGYERTCRKGFGEDGCESERGRSFGDSGFSDSGDGGFGRDPIDNFSKRTTDRDRQSGCFNCKQEGHRASECPLPRNQACYNCNSTEHISRDCPEPPRPRRNESDTNVPKKPPSTYVPKEVEVEMLFKERIKQGEMFPKLFEAEVTLTEGLYGRSEKGKRIMSFEELELTEQLMRNVVDAGYKKPTPIQQYAIPAIFKGRDIMACAETGSGKTAAFLLPVMCALIRSGNLTAPSERACCPRVLILAPTRELAVQICNEGRTFAYKTDLHVASCYGGTFVAKQLQDLRKGPTIIVGTVGRLLHFLNKGYISLTEIKYLILDEADRMLDLGFEESMNTILNHRSLPVKEERQTFMFSATFPPEVRAIASQQLKPNFLMITIGKIGVANKCITQEIIECTSLAEKQEKFFELLNVDLTNYAISKEADVFKKKTLVFVSRKLLADSLGALLSELNIPSTTMHGDRDQNQRAESLEDFKCGRKPVLIATAVAERGLDIKGVDHVINYDLPTSGQDYVHRIGRTGRVGNPGRATSLYMSTENRDLAKSLVEILTDSGQDVPEFLANDAQEGGGTRFARFGGGTSTAIDTVEEEEECWD